MIGSAGRVPIIWRISNSTVGLPADNALFRHLSLFGITDFSIKGIGRRVAGIGIKDGDLSCLQQPLGDLGYQHGPIAFTAVTAVGYYRV